MSQQRHNPAARARPAHWTGSAWTATVILRNQRAIGAALGTAAAQCVLDELADRLRLDLNATDTRTLPEGGIQAAVHATSTDAHGTEHAVRLAVTPPVQVGDRWIEPDLDVWVQRASA